MRQRAEAADISLSIASASFSATMMVGILVLPRGIVDMIEASMTPVKVAVRDGQIYVSLPR